MRGISSNYDVHHKIGEGAFGEVLMATNRVDGNHYALKRMRLRSPEQGIPAGVFREMRILQQTSHPNVRAKLHRDNSLVRDQICACRSFHCAKSSPLVQVFC
jgi:serine/threonine protein kinase